MSNTVSNVTAGKPKIGGAVFRAPVGSTLPTSASATLDSAFVGLGYTSEDGVTNGSAVATNPIKAWGGDVVLTAQEGRDDTFAMSLIETLSAEVLKVFFGDANVSGTLATGITVTANSKDLGSHAYVIDLMQRDGALKRIVIPNAQISETGDVTYKDNDVVSFPITLAAQPDASGNTHYEYILRAASAASGGTEPNTETGTEPNTETGTEPNTETGTEPNTETGTEGGGTP